jgi:hypothetical protein
MKKIILLLTALVISLGMNADNNVDQLKKRVAPWLARVEQQPDWLLSRLQMYWCTHATDVYINGESFDHPGGQRAPEPTVKFNGTRGTASLYNRPKLEDVVPYDDDSLGNVTFINRSNNVKEKAHPSKTGCNIDGLNREILSIARNAAEIYSLTGEKPYAQLALGVFSTYMKGIYYRNEPIDLNHGHQQTLVGMATFEVIHEDCANTCTQIYRLLGKYVKKDRDIYDAAFKKWADLIAANGVPHNNWDLFQAEFIFHIALVLQSDSHYADHKGREYYLDLITNQSSIRQWGIKPLADFGFDRNTGIWYESPGYSTTVVRDFANFANEMDSLAGINLYAQLPVLRKAIYAQAQYLFPNRMIAGFGDSHPDFINPGSMNSYLNYARRHRLKAAADSMSQLRQALRPDAPAREIEPYVSDLFSAPNVSWCLLRTGMHPQHDLMVSLNGSLGNHQHANGISMELYGKGWVLGPDAGIGRNLYSGLDYAEYYSQFPAHNTVCVNGISSYPVMMSSHPFHLEEQNENIDYATKQKTLSQTVTFREPESGAEQMRTNAVVKVDSTGGYYVDIFRSHCLQHDNPRLKTDFHDYFYHNLGQQMTLQGADGSDLGLQPTDELAFAGGHLYAYSYIYNKESATTARDIKATFTIHPDKATDASGDITMTMWMQGDSARTVFKALSPVNLEYERMKNAPYDIGTQPVLTFVARQMGDAWAHPFVAIYEPSSAAEPSLIERVDFFRPQSSDASAVGIKVTLKNGHTDYVFSSAMKAEMIYQGMTARGLCQILHK